MLIIKNRSAARNHRQGFPSSGTRVSTRSPARAAYNALDPRARILVHQDVARGGV